MTLSLRTTTTLAAALLGASSMAVAGVSLAHADSLDTMAACTAAGQVWVVVQAPAEATGGDALDTQACVEAPTNGVDAVAKATGGEYTSSTSQFGELVETIKGVPATPSSDPNTYWNSWQTTPVAGSTTEVNPWTFSEEGASAYVPAAGSVYGWYYNAPGWPPVSSLSTTFSDTPTAQSDDAEDASSSTGWIGWALLALAVVAAGAFLLHRLARRGKATDSTTIHGDDTAAVRAER